MDAPRPSPFCAQADFRGQADNCHLHTPFTPHLHVKIITPVKSNFTQLKTLVKKPKLAWSHFKLLTLNLDGAVTAARRQLCAPEPSPPTVRGRSHWPCPLYSHFSTRRTSTDPAPTARRTTPPTTRCHRRGGGGGGPSSGPQPIARLSQWHCPAAPARASLSVVSVSSAIEFLLPIGLLRPVYTHAILFSI